MTIRQIHLLGSPVLRQRATEVESIDDEVRAVVQDLVDTMYADQGIGLAANQIGLAHRIAVVAPDDDPPIVLINPVIREQSGTVRGEEGCLSVPDIYADVDRAQRILVETTTLDGERVTIAAEDLTSRVIQHEIDHLDGVLFLDRVGPLKRRMLHKKWQKLRKGHSGHLKDVVPAAAKD